MDAIQEVLSPEQWRIFNEPVAVELKKGECTFHHPLMIHGSFANRTERPRRATVINTFRDGVCSATDETLLESVPIIPNGQKMQGQFFPLLFDPVQSIG
jgi:ectoine hydroxylase-related dioxygenase (phytanoyl-CoA dioxygenase family)